MLVDLPARWYPTDELGTMLAGLTGDQHLRTPRRLYRGVYLAHLNIHLDLRGLVASEWPFGDQLRARMERQQALCDADPDRTPDPWPSHLPNDYGVCDHWTQILARWPELDTDPDHRYLITLTPHRRADQPPNGGWRWHKWGPYIGVFKPQCEYLHDEPEVSEVFSFHIRELHPADVEGEGEGSGG